MLISSVKTGIFCLNVWKIEGTIYFDNLKLIVLYLHFKCKKWYLKLKMFETLWGRISLLVCFYFDNYEFIQLFKSSVKLAFEVQNVENIEGTYFTSDMFSL